MEKYKIKNGKMKKINKKNLLSIKCLISKLLMMMSKNNLWKCLDHKY